MYLSYLDSGIDRIRWYLNWTEETEVCFIHLCVSTTTAAAGWDQGMILCIRFTHTAAVINHISVRVENKVGDDRWREKERL